MHYLKFPFLSWQVVKWSFAEFLPFKSLEPEEGISTIARKYTTREIQKPPTRRLIVQVIDECVKSRILTCAKERGVKTWRSAQTPRQICSKMAKPWIMKVKRVHFDSANVSTFLKYNFKNEYGNFDHFHSKTKLFKRAWKKLNAMVYLWPHITVQAANDHIVKKKYSLHVRAL